MALACLQFPYLPTTRLKSKMIGGDFLFITNVHIQLAFHLPRPPFPLLHLSMNQSLLQSRPRCQEHLRNPSLPSSYSLLIASFHWPPGIGGGAGLSFSNRRRYYGCLGLCCHFLSDLCRIKMVSEWAPPHVPVVGYHYSSLLWCQTLMKKWNTLNLNIGEKVYLAFRL